MISMTTLGATVFASIPLTRELRHAGCLVEIMYNNDRLVGRSIEEGREKEREKQQRMNRWNIVRT
jgi:hypothetical protein